VVSAGSGLGSRQPIEGTSHPWPSFQELQECLKALLRVDDSWLPEKEGYSLYLRPFIFASSYSLGVFPPSRTTLMVICSPVGPYFSDGALLASHESFLNSTTVGIE
jgi:branched-subunit amino acid aminotransferase/4-amino-4-deoxychorismate lyase